MEHIQSSNNSKKKRLYSFLIIGILFLCGFALIKYTSVDEYLESSIIRAENIAFSKPDTVQLQTANIEILEDLYYIDDTAPDYGTGLQIKYNISSIPNGMVIEDATACFYLTYVGGSANNLTRIWNINNQSWTEDSSVSEIEGLTVGTQTDVNFTSLTASTWGCLNVTEQFNIDYETNNNFSLRIESVSGSFNATDITDIYGSDTVHQIGISGEEINFYSKEYTTASLRPYLNVTYELPPNPIQFVPPTPENGTADTDTEITLNVSIGNAEYLSRFTYNFNGTNLTSAPYNLSANGLNNCTVMNYSSSSMLIGFTFDNASELGEHYSSSASTVQNLGTGADGTTQSGVGSQLIDCMHGKCFDYSSSDYISLAHSNAYNFGANPFSISLWINPDDLTTTNQGLIGADNTGDSLGWRVNLYGADVYFQAQDGSGFTSAGPLTLTDTNEWYHMVFTRSGTNMNIYLNGEFIQTNTTKSNVQSSNTGIAIGRLLATVDYYYYNGRIDDLFIYTKVLSQDEITLLYNSTLNKVSSNNWEYIKTEDGLEAGEDYYYEAFVQNSSGTWNSSGQMVYSVLDTTPPVITINYPTNNSYYLDNYTGYVNVSINKNGGNCSINDSRWSYNSGNLTFFSFLNNTEFGLSEQISLNISCWDSLLSNVSTSLFFEAEKSYTYPEVEIIYPNDFIITEENITQLNYTVSPGISSLDSCWYSKNRGITNSSSVTPGENFTISDENGERYWTVYCNDTEGYESKDIVNFVVNGTGFELYTQYDPNYGIDIESDSIKVESNNATGSVYKRLGNNYFTGLRWQLHTIAYSNEPGSTVNIFGLSSQTKNRNNWTNWTDGFSLVWESGNLSLYNNYNMLKNTTSLSLDTDYYIEIRRNTNHVNVYIYDDTGYSSLVSKLSILITNPLFYTDYLSIMNIDNNGTIGLQNITVDSHYEYKMDIVNYSDVSLAIPGDYEDNFTEMSTWTIYNNDSYNVTEIEDEQIHIKNGGAIWKSKARVGSENLYLYSADVRITSLDNGSSMAIMGLGDTGTNQYVQAVVKNDNGEYKWGFEIFNVIWGYDMSTQQFELNRTYHVQIISSNVVGAGTAVSMFVDGIKVATLNQYVEMIDLVDRIYIGDWKPASYNGGGPGEFYLDNMFLEVNVFAINGGVGRLPNGDLLAIARFSKIHGFNTDHDTDLYVLKSTDNGETWSLYQDINYKSDTGYGFGDPRGGSPFVHGNQVYYFMGVREDERRPETFWASYVYKANLTDEGDIDGDFTIVRDGASAYIVGDYALGGVLQDKVDEDIIVSTGFAFNATGYGGQFAYKVQFNTTTDRYSNFSDWIYLDQYDPTMGPLSEQDIIYDPTNDSRMIHAQRRDGSGIYYRYQSFRYSGLDYMNNESYSESIETNGDWSLGHGGSFDMIPVGSSVIGVGHYTLNGVNDRNQFIVQLDPNDLTEVVNSRYYHFTENNEQGWNSYTEAGNGEVIDPQAGSTDFYMLAPAGALGFYKIQASGLNGEVTINITGDNNLGQWRVVGDIVWQNEGLFNMAPGNYTIEFKDVSGYETPTNENFSIGTGESITIDGVYIQLNTCSPTSPLTADYVFNCADNCTISSDLNAGGYNVWFVGSGVFNLNAKIEEFDTLYKSNGCEILVGSGGGYN